MYDGTAIRLARASRPRLWVTSRDRFCRRNQHTYDQNAECDIIKTVRENMHGVALTTARIARVVGVAMWQKPWPNAASRRHGRSRTLAAVLPWRPVMADHCYSSITATPLAADPSPNFWPATPHDGSRWVWPSCRSYWKGHDIGSAARALSKRLGSLYRSESECASGEAGDSVLKREEDWGRWGQSALGST